MFVFRFASSCGFCGGGGVVVLLAWLALLALLAFLRFETSTDGSSHSSPPWPITSGTALANDTERPRWRVPFFSPPGPGLFAAELFRISLAPGHRCARAMSMRGLLEFAAEAAAALSVEGFRKSLTSESICCLLAFGSACLGESSLEKILVRHLLPLDIIRDAASCAASRASTMMSAECSSVCCGPKPLG
jgi:hypothetical protein